MGHSLARHHGSVAAAAAAAESAAPAESTAAILYCSARLGCFAVTVPTKCDAEPFVSATGDREHGVGYVSGRTAGLSRPTTVVS